MTGQVLLTGWDRPKQYNCGLGEKRQLGASFLLDLVSVSKNNQTVLEIDPIDERPLQLGDVLYCGGHTIISTADRRGMVLFTGGTQYEHLGTRQEKEFGIDYARMFEPAKGGGVFVPIHFKMPFGSSWYPTNTLLPDGMSILVTAGFFKFTHPPADNNGIALFRLDRYLTGLNPWQLLFDHNHSHPLIAPSWYTHAHVLVRPVVHKGTIYTVALFGRAGRILLLSIDSKDPSKSKWYLPLNGARPNKRRAHRGTSTLLESGDILIYGDQEISPWLDVYRPSMDSWRSLNTFSRRICVTSVLLPDGSVLLIHGENVRDNRGLSFMDDARFMQIYHPDSHSIETLSTIIEPYEQERPETGGYRQFHSFAVLLADARILLGGGVHLRGGVGCEQPNLRVFSPPYLFRGKRPIITAVQVFDESGSKVTRSDRLAYSNGFLLVELASVTLQNVSSAVLLAVGSTTHGIAQNQRILRLIRIHCGGNSLLFRIPSPPVIIPGDHLLFVLTTSGVPSVGHYLTVLQFPTHQTTHRDDDVCTRIIDIPLISTQFKTHVSVKDFLSYSIAVSILILSYIFYRWIHGKLFRDNSL